MIDHVFLSVSDLNRSIGFYERTLLPLGITQRQDFDGKDGPPGHEGVEFELAVRFVVSIPIFSIRSLMLNHAGNQQ